MLTQRASTPKPVSASRTYVPKGSSPTFVMTAARAPSRAAATATFVGLPPSDLAKVFTRGSVTPICSGYRSTPTRPIVITSKVSVVTARSPPPAPGAARAATATPPGRSPAGPGRPRSRPAALPLRREYDAGVRGRVARGGHPGRPERLDPLVVAVRRAAAVVDRRNAAVLVLEHHERRVHVPGVAVRGLDPHRAARVHLHDLAARHVARHVEVVDRHVEEEAAGDAHVLERRRKRVPARDPH